MYGLECNALSWIGWNVLILGRSCEGGEEGMGGGGVLLPYLIQVGR